MHEPYMSTPPPRQVEGSEDAAAPISQTVPIPKRWNSTWVFCKADGDAESGDADQEFVDRLVQADLMVVNDVQGPDFRDSYLAQRAVGADDECVDGLVQADLVVVVDEQGADFKDSGMGEQTVHATAQQAAGTDQDCVGGAVQADLVVVEDEQALDLKESGITQQAVGADEECVRGSVEADLMVVKHEQGPDFKDRVNATAQQAVGGDQECVDGPVQTDFVVVQSEPGPVFKDVPQETDKKQDFEQDSTEPPVIPPPVFLHPTPILVNKAFRQMTQEDLLPFWPQVAHGYDLLYAVSDLKKKRGTGRVFINFENYGGAASFLNEFDGLVDPVLLSTDRNYAFKPVVVEFAEKQGFQAQLAH